ncbi:hypothetical protein LTR02_007106 [Friedmanniomyces endolithicus]|nr:hypothetical protein LTR59_010950 [Friedmanniomyces endolithicus]KAK0791276.1 hypothetical protein LTR38_010299 [Friedmanniomyces endolithicus]KAK0806985.1 hypothetical protein LTR75_006794 [Friedmanniomyces endolithicus]KAK0858734.1 hypothetical protein LTR03_000159 [Friedmanniomyces endolithicus]KAK0860932.1 hypothetical protein LTS02_008152 [Friedmanniomyces endolithicus]
MGGLGRKSVHFDLPADSLFEMAIHLPVKSALKAQAAAPTPPQPSFEAVVIKPAKSATKPVKRKASSADGRYEVRNTKRTEYYGDGRKVTVYKKTYSYWA